MSISFEEAAQKLASLIPLCNEKIDELSQENKNKLLKLQTTIGESIQSIENILCPGKSKNVMRVSEMLNEDPTVRRPYKKFRRTDFYSTNSPYRNMKDKSGSFRVVPPIPSRNEFFTKNAQRRKEEDAAQFLLQNLPLLENLRNLKHLNNGGK